jgi:thiamine-monophosphate kinase
MTGSALRVKEIGEFELIDRLANRLPEAARANSHVLLGIGDDAAVWTPAAGTSIVVTTDTLVEDVHFRLDWTDWTSLGHKMIAVNLADIAAMGARPRLATMSLGLTGEELVADIEALYDGAGVLAAAHDVVIAGGDVVRVPHDTTLSVTAVGDVESGQVMTRSGAQPGDLIVVSGTLGASAAGMMLLQRGGDRSVSGSLLVGAHLRPNPRVALGNILFERGVTAAMDLSDGLLGDLPKILEASGVSAEVEVSAIPILPALGALFPADYEELSLRGGEDYELLLTVPEGRFKRLSERAGQINATLTPIGRITVANDRARLNLIRAGKRFDAEQGAFDHFG